MACWQSWMHEEELRNNAAFIASANPKTILALLDEIDGMNDELSACTEHPGGCGYWREAAKRRAEERDRLKAENEALRESLQALIHISDATGWEDHTCGEIAKARAALEGAKP
ncbi:ead/Ea22-like family protein [Pseudomonas aeruginosa]|nr:ead/Ea22-like family protein [Pseudomonas aeruginosa]